MTNILIVVAHSDDETIGMGATIARHTAQGDNVHLLIMSDGIGSRGLEQQQIEVEIRELSLKKAVKVLGINKVYNHNFPDNKMDSVPLLSITQAIESVLNGFPAEMIYTHSSHDLNIDHVITHQAVMTACRPQPNSTIKSILTFEVRSSTEWQASSNNQFTANYFIDVSCYFNKKIAALTCYQQEIRPFPHSRSIKAIEAQAISRGCSIGVEYAEAFYLERLIISSK